MALIKCTECGSIISNKAIACVKCGCPISNTLAGSNNSCIINDIAYDFDQIKDLLLENPNNDTIKNDAISFVYNHIHGIQLFDAALLVETIINTGEIPKQYSREKLIPRKINDGLIHCPKCDSTNVVTGQRGYSVIWGFAGSNRTMNRCAKCGHKWEPKK